MGPQVNKLLSFAGGPILDEAAMLPNSLMLEKEELKYLLNLRNGFFSFENALHVFPIGSTNLYASGYDLMTWNSDQLWRNDYADLAIDYLFFAEDVFGCQFAYMDDRVCRFDPETGKSEEMAANLEEWANQILINHNVETGYPLAHQWKQRNGILLPFQRLVPKIPFVVGGEFTIDNLYAVDAAKGMRSRASFAVQIRGLPNGAKIKLKTI